MFGLLTLGKAVLALTPPGAAYFAVASTVRTIDLYSRIILYAEAEDLNKKGINLAEERYHELLYGGTEPYFPFEFKSDSFPENIDKLVGEKLEGRFIFKLSEWHDLINWLSILIQNETMGADKRVGRDGRWLLHVGLKRWEDHVWVKRAFENVALHPEVLEEVPLIMKQLS